jgi:hypothetical protein
MTQFQGLDCINVRKNFDLPEFLISNSHVELPRCSRIGEEQLQLLHTAAMEICDKNALAPNLHAMPGQLKKTRNIRSFSKECIN